MVMRTKLIVKRSRPGKRASFHRGQALDQLAQIIESLPADMDAAVIRGLQSAAMRGVGEVQHAIDSTKPHPPVSSGELRRSVMARNTDLGAVLSVDAPHAPYMEMGTRPFRPPLAPLAAWAMDKKIATTEKEAIAVARGIQEKFAKFGIRPRHFFRRAMREIKSRVIPAEVKRELKHG